MTEFTLPFVVGAAGTATGAKAPAVAEALAGRSAGKGAIRAAGRITAKAASTKAMAAKRAVGAGGRTGWGRERSHRHKTDAVLVVNVFDSDFQVLAFGDDFGRVG